jgi:hypothetical protein
MLLVGGALFAIGVLGGGEVLEEPEQPGEGGALAPVATALFVEAREAPQGLEVREALGGAGPARGEGREVERAEDGVDDLARREEGTGSAQARGAARW